MKNHFWLLLVLSFTLLSCGTTTTNIPDNAIVYFVSPEGNDQWSGNLPDPLPSDNDGPFATIKRARDEIRSLKSSEEFNQPVLIFLRGGTYYLEEPLIFNPEDSGTENTPISYVAYPGEKPILSGGKHIEKEWQDQTSSVKQTHLPEVEKGDWDFYQLFIKDERQTRARTPNKGYYQMESPMRLEGPAHFTYPDEVIKSSWVDLGDVSVVALAKWAEIHMPIKEVNESDNTVTLSKQVPPSNWRGVNNARFWIENAPEALDQPGEWRLERDTGILSLMTKPDAELNKVVAPHLEQLLILRGDPENEQYVHHLEFRDLHFKHTMAPQLGEGYPDVQAAHDISAAIHANGANDCTIRQCTFSQLGNYAIELIQGCKNNRLIHNEIQDVGAGGIKIGETSMRTEAPLMTQYNQVSDNHIYDIGKIYPAAVGVWVGQSDHNTIAHNHIHHTFYTGISVGWTWGYHPTGAHHNTIEYNHVHHIGQGILSDMGGIYTLGTQPGTVIRNNFFHHIESYGYGGWGIYPDEGSTNILIENNITYKTKSAGFHQHYGKENIIRNNIFTYGREYQVMRTRAEDHLSFSFTHNIVYWEEGELLGSNWSGDHYQFDYNLYWNPTKKDFKFAQWSWPEWQARGQDRNSKIADPLFVNIEKMNFNLSPKSPAFDLGFKKIDMSPIGPRSSKRQ